MNIIFNTCLKNYIADYLKDYRRCIIVLLFSLLPIVDSINGWLIRNGSFSIGTVYKIFAILCVFILMINGNVKKKYLLSLLVVVLYITGIVFINVVILRGNIIEFDYIIKLLYNILLILLLLQCYKSRILCEKDFYNLLNINAILVVFCILIPYALGLGYSVYAGDIGYKAYYYSQNELSSILVILFFFCIYKIINKFKVITLIHVAAIMVCALLLNTKACIIACVLGLFVWFLTVMIKKPVKYKIAMLVLLVLGIVALKDVFINSISSSFERQQSLYNNYGGAIFSTILSGRDFKFEQAWEQLMNSEYTIFQMLFGNGFCSNILVEMDMCDIFFYTGSIGTIAVIVALVVIYIKSWPQFRQDHSIIRPFAYLLIIALFCLSGHVLFMATAGCYFAIFCCFNMTYRSTLKTN